MWCVGVCLYIVFRPNLDQDSLKASSLASAAGNSSALCIFTSVCNLSVTCAAAVVFLSLVCDVYTRSNRESIWWAGSRVFEECQGASGCTHTHASTNILTHINIHFLCTLTVSVLHTVKHSSAVTVAPDRGCCRTVEDI